MRFYSGAGAQSQRKFTKAHAKPQQALQRGGGILAFGAMDMRHAR
jgi:hypothetical protein